MLFRSIYGAAVALSSSYIVSLVLLVAIAFRHGELESAGRSLLSLPGDSIQSVRGSAGRAEVVLQGTDGSARVS